MPTEEKDPEERSETMQKLEEDPPKKLEDWPDDDAMYETFGGPEGDHGYDEGPEKQLGPSGLRHFEDGRVEIDGEEVDDPEEYKGEPIPGGPTDPDAKGPEVDKENEKDSDDDDGDDSDEPKASAEDDSDDDGDADAKDDDRDD